MSKIRSNELLNTVYKCLSNQGNQGTFIIRFFVAAGNSKYHLPAENKKPKSSEVEGPKHYANDRPVTAIKEYFPCPINKKEAAEYLLASFDNAKVRMTMDALGIPSDVPQNNRAFAYAIVEQFNSYIESADEDLPNNIYIEFLKYSQLNEKEIEDAAVNRGSRYAGDNIFLSTHENQKRHDVECYSRFTHTWNISNYGTQTWTGRKLVLVNQDKIRPRTPTPIIEVPETRPGGRAIIEVVFEARTSEGEYEAKWEMQDSQGMNCFATQPSLFNFVINTQYKVQRSED